MTAGMNSYTDKLEVVGVYSNEGEVELRGTIQGLQQLAELIAFAPAPVSRAFALPGTSAFPYDGFLARVSIEEADRGAMKIWQDHDSLHISGSPESRKLLSANLNWLTSQTSDVSSHLHLEPYEGHVFLDFSSQPVVVILVASLEQ